MTDYPECPVCGESLEKGTLRCPSCNANLDLGSEEIKSEPKKDVSIPAVPPPSLSIRPLSGDFPLQKKPKIIVPNSSNFITLSCPTCSGKLEITPDIDRFACGYCGNEHLVKRSGGVVRIEAVVKAIGDVNKSVQSLKPGVDRTALELTIVRLKEESLATDKLKVEKEKALAESGGGLCCGCGCALFLVLLAISFLDFGASSHAAAGDAARSVFLARLCGYALIGALLVFVHGLYTFPRRKEELAELEKDKAAKLEKIQKLTQEVDNLS